jgi:quinol monooxygenase YgiN
MGAILRIEHPVPDYDAWKRAFDADPIGRAQAGVQRYRIMRPVDDVGRVLIDLEFDDAGHAEAMLARLRALWATVDGTIMSGPEVRIVDVVEAVAV